MLKVDKPGACQKRLWLPTNSFHELYPRLSFLPKKKPEIIGPQFDYLANTKPALEPPFRTSDPTKRAAVVACMRNEGIVILEWVAHYRALGFDSVIIYTNANDDGSDELLLALHKAGIITVIWNDCRPDVSPQLKAYRHAFWHLSEAWDHSWIAFLDADEFLIPLIDGRVTQINDYLDHIEQRYNASAISLNWRWFAGDQQYQRGEGLLFERYQDSSWDDHVKTLFRLRDVCHVDVHCPKMLPGRSAIGGGGTVRTSPSHAEQPNGDLGQINHYWQRSFQEFYIKRQRGRGAGDREPRAWTTFFDWHSKSKAEPDAYPDGAHIEHVHAEVKYLRQFRSVRRARRDVERIFDERLQSSDVQAIYAATAAEVACSFSNAASLARGAEPR